MYTKVKMVFGFSEVAFGGICNAAAQYSRI